MVCCIECEGDKKDMVEGSYAMFCIARGIVVIFGWWYDPEEHRT